MPRDKSFICPLVDKVLVSGKSLGCRKSRGMTMVCVDLVGYDVVRFGSDFGQILVRFLGKIGQIVSPIFWNFGQI